jgi:hypothetical protein
MDRVVFYELSGRHKRWCWRVDSLNGAPLAISARSYHDERSARRAFNNLLKVLAPMVKVLEKESG